MLSYNTTASALPSYYHLEEFEIPTTTSNNLTGTTIYPDDYQINDGSSTSFNCFDLYDYHIDVNYVGLTQSSSSYVNLSPISTDDGVGYIQYNIDAKIYKADIDLSLYSSDEGITTSNTEAYIEYRNSNGDWVTSLDLLNDISLNEGYTNLETKTVYFPDGTSKFRIYTSSTTTNKEEMGRFSIGNVIFYTKEE